MNQPTDPRVAYQRGLRLGAVQVYDAVIAELEHVVAKLRQERAALYLPRRTPPPQREGGEQR